MTGVSPNEILASRRWEQALFTTYALSLTFFESIVLRHLRQQGCRDIWVITDAEGYRASLMERRSGRVGQEYRLIPVGLPRGVFHPKCSYLSGPEGDLLLIGSGNLTFGGHGRNLEVLEVLEPASAPDAFEDFARFLDALGARQDFIAPDPAWASTFASLARRAARANPRQALPRQPRLIHTVSSPAVDQLADVCASNGGGQHLVVLSPFHDPDGSAVRELAEKTGCARVDVGIQLRDGAPSPFPFAKARGWTHTTLRAVRPVVLPADQRGLHAKWFEVQLPEATLTLTGSINATTKSLCTTDNIEVGVLRLESATQARWVQAATPKHDATPTYRTSGMGQSCLVHASLLGDGTLAGRVLATSDASGPWTGMLVLANGEHVDISLTAGPRGDFRTPLPNAERFAFGSTLQLEVRQGERIARGWVHLDEILRMPRLQRLGVSSLMRLINREETEDDDLALLDYFAMSSSRHLATFAQRIKSAPQGPEQAPAQDTPEVVVDLEALAPDPDFVGWAGQAASGGGPQDEATLQRVLAQLRKRLITQPAARGALSAELAYSASVLDDEDSGGGDNAASQRRTESALEYFDAQMQALADDADPSAAASAALVIWFEVGMHMLLRRLKDRTRAVAFLKRWFYEACSRPRLSEKVGSLEQHVFTSAALIPLLAAADTDQPALRTRLHEALERFSNGDVDPARARAALLVDEHVGFSSLLLEGQPLDLRGSLDALLSMRTCRWELQQVMRAYRERRMPDRQSPLFGKDRRHGPELLAALSRPGLPRPNVKEQRSDAAVCAHCFVALNTTSELDLSFHRVAQCTSCHRLTVRLKP